MKQVCSGCHYIGEIIKPRYHTYKFLLSGLLIAMSTNAFMKLLYENIVIGNKSSFDSITAFLLFPSLILIAGIFLLHSDLKSKKLNKKSSRVFHIFAIFLFVNGVILLVDYYISMEFYKIPTSIILIFFGAIAFYWYSRDSITCPNCEKRETLIPIDEPRAQTIIKENNLTIPDDPIETGKEPKTKMPWQSN